MTVSIRSAWRGGRDGRPGWYLVIPFDAGFVAAVKMLPSADRAWCPEEANGAGAWWVAEERETALVVICPAFEAYLKQPQLF